MLAAALARGALLADEVHHHFPRMRHVPVFPKINALPRAEREVASAKRDTEIHGRKRGADVRRHVVRAFAGVLEERVAIRHEAFEETFEIGAHIRVGILLNQERGRGVLQMQREQAVRKILPREPGFDFRGEVIQPASAGGETEFVRRLAKHKEFRLALPAP